MSKLLYALWIVIVGIGISAPSPAQETQDLRESIAKEFAGVYHFNYLFVENGIPYVDVADHLQFLELDKFEGAPPVTFLETRPAKAKSAATTAMSCFSKATSLAPPRTRRRRQIPFRLRRNFSIRTKRTFECSAPRAPKPARDTDSPITRKIGLFKRPTTWQAYEVLDRHNLFRFYDWGFVNVQANVKLDADGKAIAREAGVMTALKIKASAGEAKP